MNDEPQREEPASQVSDSREIPGATPSASKKLGPPASQVNDTPAAEEAAKEVLLKPGDRIGGCVVTRFLAWGGMGEVHEGRHETLDRRVAIKLVRGKYAEDPKYHARFLREAKQTAKLVDPHVALVFDAGERDGKLYAILEFLEGEDVSRKLEREGRLAPDEALRIARDVALGLGAAHAVGIIHRDVKPSNIMVGPNGTAKLMDFGLARATDTSDAEHPDAGVVTGTPQYMSPEQWRDENLDPRADLYSLGVTLYEMLANCWPFDTNSMTKICEQVTRRQLRPLRDHAPGLDAEIYNLVDWMLAPFDVRCASARELASRIDKLLAKRPARPARKHSSRQVKAVDARLPPPSQAQLEPGPSRGLWIAGGAALIGLCLVLGIWRPWENKPGDAVAGSAASGPNQYPPGTRLAPLELHWTAAGFSKARYALTDLATAPELATGDAWQVQAIPAQDCHVYAVWLDPAGAVTQIHPQNEDTFRVSAGQTLVLPAAWATLSPAQGTHTIYVVASYLPLERVATLLKSLQQRTARGVKPEPSDIRLLAQAMEEATQLHPPPGVEIDSAHATQIPPQKVQLAYAGSKSEVRALQTATGRAGVVLKLTIKQP